jgi:hypothetical protein
MMAKTTIRKVGSLFFLGIFLWFYSVKDLHDILHFGDEHCHVLNAKHFHTQEHHCPICEFQFPGFDDQSVKLEVSSHNFFVKVQNTFVAQAVSFEPLVLSSPRAPPAVA